MKRAHSICVGICGGVLLLMACTWLPFGIQHSRFELVALGVSDLFLGTILLAGLLL